MLYESNFLPNSFIFIFNGVTQFSVPKIRKVLLVIQIWYKFLSMWHYPFIGKCRLNKNFYYLYIGYFIN